MPIAMDAAFKKKLENTAREIRCLTIDAISRLGVGHIGGSLSIVELLTILYWRHLTIDPADPRKRDRDWLVLSKGHAGPALYSALALRGYFPREWLNTLNQGGTNLPSHCDRNRTPGIDMTTGSLGQGISAAVGIALGNRMDGLANRVYAIIGDGESNEGQVWEAAMAARQFRLSNLVAFTDFNKMQIDGWTRDIMDLEDIAAKWQSFGWHTQRIDGHDFEALDAAILATGREKERPSMIILDTVKGKGARFAEGNLGNHNMNIDAVMAKAAIDELCADSRAREA
jgi:transketolase